jgi:predicted HicB family RNase H-like nuclease
MPKQKKSKRVGRPTLPRGQAKARIVPVRFNEDDLKRIESAAKSRKQSLSEWIRTAVTAAILS